MNEYNIITSSGTLKNVKADRIEIVNEWVTFRLGTQSVALFLRPEAVVRMAKRK